MLGTLNIRASRHGTLSNGVTDGKRRERTLVLVHSSVRLEAGCGPGLRLRSAVGWWSCDGFRTAFHA